MKTALKTLALLFAVFLSSSATADENITGTWVGKLIIGPDTELAIQFVIKRDANGAYAAVLNTPDEGNVENVAANQVVYDAGQLKIDVSELSGSYDGVVKNGKIEGEWKQEGTSFPLILKPYEKPTLSQKDMDALLGTWHGKLVPPEGVTVTGEPPTFLVRFEMSEKGEFTGVVNMPESGSPDFSLTDMGISDGTFTFIISDMKSKFKGELSALLAAGVALLTVALQSYKTTRTNPVEALRYE